MEEYLRREVIKETGKAYLVSIHVSTPFKNVTEFKWVAKSICGKEYLIPGTDGKMVEVPIWATGICNWELEKAMVKRELENRKK